MSDGLGIRAAGSRTPMRLLVVAVGLGVVLLGSGLFQRIEGSGGGSTSGSASRPAAVQELSGSAAGFATLDRTPIRVEIERRRDAKAECELGDRVPIRVMVACWKDVRAGSGAPGDR